MPAPVACCHAGRINIFFDEILGRSEKTIRFRFELETSAILVWVHCPRDRRRRGWMGLVHGASRVLGGRLLSRRGEER